MPLGVCLTLKTGVNAELINMFESQHLKASLWSNSHAAGSHVVQVSPARMHLRLKKVLIPVHFFDFKVL